LSSKLARGKARKQRIIDHHIHHPVTPTVALLIIVSATSTPFFFDIYTLGMGFFA